MCKHIAVITFSLVHNIHIYSMSVTFWKSWPPLTNITDCFRNNILCLKQFVNTTFRGNLDSLETLKKCFFFATDQMEKVYIKAQNTWSHACIWTMLSNFCFNFRTVDSVFSHSTARTMICQIDYLFAIC